MLRVPAWFDFPMACLGAVVSAALVAAVNSDHGSLAALTAALKQAFYAFFATGLIMRFSQWLALRPIARLPALAMAVVIPLLVTWTLLYGVHSLKGTPEPFNSTLPGTGLSLLGLLLVTWKTGRAATAPPAGPGPAPGPARQDS